MAKHYWITLCLLILLAACNQQNDPCIKISDHIQKDECYLEQGKSNQNPAFCDKITNKGFAHECYTDIAIATYDVNACYTNLSNPNYCLHEIAYSTNDDAICESMNDMYWKELCYQNIAENFNKPKLCFNLTNSPDSDRCFYNTAINFSNEELCSKMALHYICYQSGDCYWGSHTKDNCYRKLSVQKNNMELCEKIDDLPKKGYCYRDFAMLKKDKKICDKIEFTPIKAICIGQLNQTSFNSSRI